MPDADQNTRGGVRYTREYFSHQIPPFDLWIFQNCSVHNRLSLPTRPVKGSYTPKHTVPLPLLCPRFAARIACSVWCSVLAGTVSSYLPYIFHNRQPEIVFFRVHRCDSATPVNSIFRQTPRLSACSNYVYFLLPTMPAARHSHLAWHKTPCMVIERVPPGRKSPLAGQTPHSGMSMSLQKHLQPSP